MMDINMGKVIQFNSKTAGRDKLARLVQYASKILWRLLQQINANSESINNVRNLEYILGNFRRLLRLGRCLDFLYMAMSTMGSGDTLVRFNCAISKISYSMFLLCDHIVWFGRAGLVTVDTQRWSQTANKYWLLTILVNLVRDYQEIKRLLVQSMKGGSRTKLTLARMTELMEDHKDVLVDTLKNVCDLFIPLTMLDYIRLGPGTIGCLGVVSSLAGIYALLDPYAKLPLS